MQQGKYIIIIGNPEHPEVKGIKGWAGEQVCCSANIKQILKNLSVDQAREICIVAQTTFNYNKFQDLVEIISKKSYDVSVLNTICSATKERQTGGQEHCGRGGCYDSDW